MRPIFRSIRSRIIWMHIIAVAAVSIALPLAVRLLLNSTALSFEHENMRRHEVEIAQALRWTGSGWQLDLPQDLRTLYEHGYSGFAFAIVDDKGKVLFSSLRNQGALMPPGPPGGKASFFQEKHGGVSYYGGSYPERRLGPEVWIQVAQDLDNPDVVVDDIVSDFLKRIAWLILPLLALLALIDLIIVRRAFAPVVHASEMARGIGPATLSLRLPADPLPDEIAPLARAVNQALDRLEQGFRTQREFTADAAHELRTPLSILRMRVNTLADKTAAREIEADIDVMTRIVGQLLNVAELESFVLDAAQRVDLRALGSRVVEYMAPLALAKDRRLAFSGPARPVWIRGEEEILFQAIRNLVENAIAHSPEGGAVDVKVEALGVLRVLDRGPGIAPDERDMVFRRFWRRDRSRSGGAGLGLAIVHRIVEAHGGSVSVEGRPGGGAAFVIRLQRADPPSREPAVSRPAPVPVEDG
jgi:signal transduction histidine kinase